MHVVVLSTEAELHCLDIRVEIFSIKSIRVLQVIKYQLIEHIEKNSADIVMYWSLLSHAVGAKHVSDM